MTTPVLHFTLTAAKLLLRAAGALLDLNDLITAILSARRANVMRAHVRAAARTDDEMHRRDMIVAAAHAPLSTRTTKLWYGSHARALLSS